MLRGKSRGITEKPKQDTVSKINKMIKHLHKLFLFIAGLKWRLLIGCSGITDFFNIARIG